MEAVLAAAERSGVADQPDFDSWVAARGPALLRFAYTLTGNRADAEDVVQDALSRALPRWARISSVEDVDAYVRRMVVNAHTSWWRKFRRRESPVEAWLADRRARGCAGGGARRLGATEHVVVRGRGRAVRT